MTILTNIPNGASYRDFRDTVNAILGDVAALKSGTGTPTPTPAPSLTALTLAASSIQENSASGTVIGGLLGRTSGSTLALVDALGNRFALSGTNLVAGATSTDYETATSHQVTVRETLAGATNSPRDSLLTIGVTNVNEQPNLSALTLTGAGSLKNGTTATGAISGATAGSTITASGLPAGFTINGPARTWAFDGTTPAGSTNATLTETLGDSANSPRQSAVIVTIGAAAATAPTGFAMNGSTNPKMKAGLARVTGSSGRMRVAFVGDSTTAGVGAALTSGTGNNAAQSAGARAYRPSAVFAAQMAAAGYPAADIGQYADSGVSAFGASLPSYDPRIAVGAPAWAWQSSMDFAGGGYTKTAIGAFTFAHPDPVDRYEIYFLTQFGVTISLYIDDVAVPNANITIGAGGSKSGSTISISSDPSGFCKVNITVARGVHTLKMVGSSDGGLMQSVRAWDSTVSAIDVLNLAAAGEQSMHAEESPAPYNWALLNMLGAEAPDLTVINLGLNDANANVSASTYAGHLQRIITKAKAYGDVLLVSPHPATAGFAPIATQQALRDAAAAVAASNNVAYLDLSASYSSWAAAEQAYADDTVHLRRQGYAKVGLLYRQCIQAMAA